MRRLTVPVSVSRSDIWVGWWDDTQCYHQPCSSLRLSPPTHHVVILTRLMFRGKISSGGSLMLCAQILVGLSARNESFNFRVLIHHNSIFCHWTSSQDSLGGRLVGFCRPGLMTVTPGPDCRHQSETRVGASLTNERPEMACPGPSSQGEETAVSSVVVQCFSG